MLRFLVVVIGSISLGANSFAASYRVIDLGTFGGKNAVARGINNNGDVVGEAETETGGPTPFLWTRSGLAKLDPLYLERSGQANDISDNGQIVGTVGDRAFVWGTGMISYIAPPPGQTRSFGNAINGLGIVVGTSADPDSAFLWPGTGMAAEKLFTGGAARDINDSGRVVGDYNGRACLLFGGVVTYLGGQGSVAKEINNVNQVAGWADGRAVVWQNGEQFSLLDFGSDSYANGINDAGMVVGYANFGGYRGFVWKEGRAIDVNNLIESDLMIANLLDINNSGSIVGVGIDRFGHSRAVMLLPIPEPTSSLLFLGLIFCLCGRCPDVARANNFQ